MGLFTPGFTSNFGGNKEPDLSTSFTLYAPAYNRDNQVGINDYNDYKLVMTWGDSGSKNAANLSWKFYVNSTTGTGTVTWVELERFYPFGSNV